jgi:predicted metal-dependent hydrolase
MRVIRTKRKTIALIIQSDGSLLVRAPLRCPQSEIDRLVSEKAEWIASKQALVRQQAAQNQPLRYQAGELFPYLGQIYPLRVYRSQQKRPRLELKGGEFWLPDTLLPHAAAAFESWYRAQARQFITGRVQRLAQQHNLQHGRVAINSARTRWGSCGPSGSLNFTWRLVLAPVDVIDYVVAHELAHLKERNHSPRFWAEVERLMPGYRPLRAWLKQHGRSLSADRL